ncbi:MAG: S8 family serine peptidase [Pseudomonadota bacterium]
MKTTLKLSAASALVATGFLNAAQAQEETASAVEFSPELSVHLGEVTTGPLTPQSDLVGDYGSLDAFYGSLDAFYGSLDAFYGPLDAFYGSLDAFYGSLDAFYGSLDAFWGSLDAFYGSLDAFYGSLDAFYGSLDAFSGGDRSTRGFDPSSGLYDLFSQAESSFGDVVLAKTGRSFQDEVIAPLLQKYGWSMDAYLSGEISGDNRSRDDYARLMIELHDKLMTFTGVDHIDHWMGSINWSPKVSQSANGGAGVVVGLLDTPILSLDLIGGSVQDTNGFGLSSVDHGAGVASVLAGAHDGQGVMGVAPNADFLVFNPFNETFTAEWRDVRVGIQSLSMFSDASVINMSLGVAGWTFNPDWVEVFYDWRAGFGTTDTVLVKSAGNSGISQAIDVDFGISDVFRRFIIVGSVNPNNEISTFSNRPGTACFIHWGECREGNRLMDRFIVAPGEMILVQDNAGNLSRATGTSLAAPQVAGAAALIQSKWEWLQHDAYATTEILLETATDLGAPGTDEIYGRGLLNVEAALAPIDPTALYVQTADSRINISDVGGLGFDALGLVSRDTSVTAFEDVGGSRRDFEIELSSLNMAANLEAANPLALPDQYMNSQLATAPAVQQTEKKAKKDKKKKRRKKRKNRDRDDFAFTNNLTVGSFSLGTESSRWTATFTTNRRDPNEIVEADALQFQTTTTLVNNETGMRLMFGEGQGALAFSGGSEFGLLSDHNLLTGGVNPLLGLASGGTFAGAQIPFGNRLSFDIGVTQDTDRQGAVDPISQEWREAFSGLADHEASAVDMKVGYVLSPNLDVSVGYTQVNEATGLLGLQGTGALALEGGARTDAVTFGANADLARGMSVSFSATGGRTRETQFDQSIFAVGDEGVQTSAFQIVGSKQGVFGETDAIRMSFAQPLFVEGGALTQATMQVTDRPTGAAELVTQTVALGGQTRRFVSEMVYATTLQDGRASLSTFAQYDTDLQDLAGPQGAAVTAGLRYTTRF